MLKNPWNQTEAPQQEELLRKKGIQRVWELIARDFGGMFLSGLLALVGFVPVLFLVGAGVYVGDLLMTLAGGLAGGILVGPSLCGVFDTVLRAARDEPFFWWNTYKKAMRQNWKKSILPGVIFSVLLSFVAWFSSVLIRLTAGGYSTGLIIWMIAAVDLFLLFGVMNYFWAQFVLLTDDRRVILKNSVLALVAFLPRAAAAALVQIIYWCGILLTLPVSTMFLLLCNFWLPVELCVLIIYPGLEQAFHIEEGIRNLHK